MTRESKLSSLLPFCAAFSLPASTAALTSVLSAARCARSAPLWSVSSLLPDVEGLLLLAACINGVGDYAGCPYSAALLSAVLVSAVATASVMEAAMVAVVLVPAWSKDSLCSLVDSLYCCDWSHFCPIRRQFGMRVPPLGTAQ